MPGLLWDFSAVITGSSLGSPYKFFIGCVISFNSVSINSSKVLFQDSCGTLPPGSSYMNSSIMRVRSSAWIFILMSSFWRQVSYFSLFINPSELLMFSFYLHRSSWSCSTGTLAFLQITFLIMLLFPLVIMYNHILVRLYNFKSSIWCFFHNLWFPMHKLYVIWLMQPMYV